MLILCHTLPLATTLCREVQGAFVQECPLSLLLPLEKKNLTGGGCESTEAVVFVCGSSSHKIYYEQQHARGSGSEVQGAQLQA